MRYQQTPISRLSKAAKYLVPDGTWHPFAEEPGMFYRVSGKIVQRVRFEADEREDLLRLFDVFEPLPARVLKEGFREELRILIEDDRYLLTGMLVRVYVGWELLAAAAQPLGIRLVFIGGNSLQYSILFAEWNEQELVRVLVLAKAFAKVAALLAADVREGIPHIRSEITGLITSAFEMMMEEIGPVKKAKKKIGRQGSLFGE